MNFLSQQFLKTELKTDIIWKSTKTAINHKRLLLCVFMHVFRLARPIVNTASKETYVTLSEMYLCHVNDIGWETIDFLFP